MVNKYDWLTKDILEQDYNKLGNFKLISEKYKIPRSTIEKYCKKFEIETTSKIRYICNDNIFSTNTEESFYLAGFIAADGCINKHKSKIPNSLTITLSKKDELFLDKIKKILEFSGPIKTITKKMNHLNVKWNDTEQVRINIYSKKIIKDLERFNIGQNKSLNYSFPEWIMNSSFINHFMRGYADGDGSFFITHEHRLTKKYGIRTYSKMSFGIRGTKMFLTSFKNVLSNNKISTKSIPKFNNGIDLLKYSGNIQVKKVAQFLYKNSSIYMDRKYNLIKDKI